ncbi:MAG: sugar kinase [Peptococcaceae bacterium]|jgi:NAD kinase|nr:sugar kinase [Peptococcaceae bacterium]
MSYLSERKIVLITKQTRADELVKKYNNMAQASYYVQHMGGDIGEYVEEAKVYKTAVADSSNRLQNLARMQQIDVEHVPNFIFGEDDIVIVLGQDGLVANTLKYLKGQPLIAVNPDPARYDGVLLPFRSSDLTGVVQDVLNNRRSTKEITMAAAELNDGQSLLAVNDFFIGRQTHVSARYTLKINGKEENQSSSGIIVSTGLGSTGWLKSVLAGAREIAATLAGAAAVSGQEFLPGTSVLPWNSNYLYYSVREPFPSNTTGTTLVFGKIQDSPLSITSQMPENGVIFSDGVEQDFLRFNAGIEARISVAAKKGSLVV